MGKQLITKPLVIGEQGGAEIGGNKCGISACHHKVWICGKEIFAPFTVNVVIIGGIVNWRTYRHSEYVFEHVYVSIFLPLGAGVHSEIMLKAEPRLRCREYLEYHLKKQCVPKRHCRRYFGGAFGGFRHHCRTEDIPHVHYSRNAPECAVFKDISICGYLGYAVGYAVLWEGFYHILDAAAVVVGSVTRLFPCILLQKLLTLVVGNGQG